MVGCTPWLARNCRGVMPKSLPTKASHASHVNWPHRKRSKKMPKTMQNDVETMEIGAESNQKRRRNNRKCRRSEALNSTRTARFPRARQFKSNSNAKEKYGQCSLDPYRLHIDLKDLVAIVVVAADHCCPMLSSKQSRRVVF